LNVVAVREAQVTEFH